MLEGSNAGLQESVLEIMRALLDPATMPQKAEAKPSPLSKVRLVPTSVLLHFIAGGQHTVC